jgi:hypothetical protein
MKRKPVGSNHKAIQKFLQNVDEASAAEIKRATKTRSNIYQILNKMIDLGLIKKNDKKYRIALGGETQKKPEPQLSVPTPNARRIVLLIDEIEHIKAGITSLNITLNYLERRVEQLSGQES